MKQRKSALFLILMALMAIVLTAPVSVFAKTQWLIKTGKHYRYDNAKWIITYQTTNKYNNKGQQTLYKWTDYSNDGSSSSTSETKYKYKNGRLNKVSNYNNGTLTGYSVYSYKGKGKNAQIKKITRYSSDKKVEATEKPTYYTKGKAKGLQKKAVITYSDKRKFTTTYTYSFHNNGNIKKETIKTSEGKQITKYTKKGIISENSYTSSDSSYSWKDTYKNGKLKLSVWKTDYSSSTTNYNSDGWEEKHVYTHKNSDGSTSSNTTTYKYKKKNGRVATQTVYENDKPVSKTEYTWQKVKVPE